MKRLSNVRISKSTVKGKQLTATFIYRGKERVVHFGDPTLSEYPGTTRGDNYCARSYGITDKNNNFTRDDPLSANYWSRKVLWNCRGKKSL